MSILDRPSLEQSSLADLHAIASELSIDSYRRLRKAELVDLILERQGGGEGAEVGERAGEDEAAGQGEAEPAPRRRRGRRGGRGRGGGRTEEGEARQQGEASEEGEGSHERPEEIAAEPEGADEQVVEGVVELLPNGSGFVRVNPPEPSDDDVYISGAQVKRCELVTGDRVTGPRRPPRRSERFAALVRIDTVNGSPADELANAVRFDDLPAAFPSKRFELRSEDPTVKAIEWLTPIGRGSRVTIAGPPRAGKTEALRRLMAALTRDPELQLHLVLAGVRPEEIPEWSGGAVQPSAAVSLAGSPDAQAQAVEAVVEQARRLAARGADAVVLIDTLDGLHPHAAHKALAAARNIVEGGSLTVIATASRPLGGETTVIALDPLLASAGRFPALDLGNSWTIRPELLVGEDGAEAIRRARVEALEA